MSYAGSMGRLAWTQQAPCGAQRRCWLPAPQRLRSTAICSQPVCTQQPSWHLVQSRRACLGGQPCGSSIAVSSSLWLRQQPWSHSQRWDGVAPLLALPDRADSSPGTGVRMVTGADPAQYDRVEMDSQVVTGSGSSASEAGSSSGEQSDSTVASVPLSMPRRSLQLQFTCGKCGATTQRMINPVAWNRGLVFAQCGGCEVWHNIRDAAGLIKEYRLKEVDDSDESVAGSP